MSSLCNSRLKNIFKSIPYSKKLNRQEQTPAQPVIQLNPFFAHPDQLLLAMCSDDDDISIRLLAICYHSEKNCKVNEYQVKDNKELESTTFM